MFSNLDGTLLALMSSNKEVSNELEQLSGTSSRLGLDDHAHGRDQRPYLASEISSDFRKPEHREHREHREHGNNYNMSSSDNMYSLGTTHHNDVNSRQGPVYSGVGPPPFVANPEMRMIGHDVSSYQSHGLYNTSPSNSKLHQLIEILSV